MRKLLVPIAALVTLAAAGALAQTQPYPTGIIKLIVPYTVGSPVDAAARLIVEPLQADLGKSIVIENRPGAGTTIGTRDVVSAKPDGYTLLFTGSSLTFFSVLYPKLDFDPLKTLTPVATAVSWSHVLVVRPEVPATNMAELISYAKSNPGKLKFGYGLGTPPHILAAALTQATGANITLVPYKGGEQARTDLLGGHIDINMAPVGSLLAFIQQGKMRPLAFTGRTRAPALPDVPTMAESGLPQLSFDPDAWLGFLAPAGTPPEIVNKLNTAVNESLKSPKAVATFKKLGFDTKAVSPREFATFLAAEMQKWPPRVRAAGLEAE